MKISNLGTLGILLIMVFGCLGLIIGINVITNDYKPLVIKIKPIYNMPDTCDELTKITLYNEIIKDSILFPNIVYKQVMLETGHLKCINCSLVNNNLFGFYNGKNYLKFNTWRESVKYYKVWQIKNYKSGDYYNFLISIGYAKDTNYINILKRIKI